MKQTAQIVNMEGINLLGNSKLKKRISHLVFL